MHENNKELLAQELKKLVGKGAKPQHVLSCPLLCELVEKKHPGLTTSALKQTVLAELKYAADQTAMPEALRQLLMLGRWYIHVDAVNRREQAIRLLKLGVNVETFRRPEGREMDLMRDFAEVLWRELELAG